MPCSERGITRAASVAPGAYASLEVARQATIETPDRGRNPPDRTISNLARRKQNFYRMKPQRLSSVAPCRHLLPAAHRLTLRFSVHLFDYHAITLFDGAAFQLHAGGQGAVVGGKLFRDQQYALQLLEARQVFVQLRYNALIQRLHLVMANQFLARSKLYFVVARPVLEQGEIWQDQHGRELALVAQDHRFGNQGVVLQGVLERLWSDELSSRGLDQVFLAVGHGEVSFGIEVADVPGPEPAVHKRTARFLGTVPVAVKHRRPAHQDFPVVGNPHFHIRQRFPHRAQLVRLGVIDGNHGRSLGQAITFENADADVGVPFGQLASQRRAPGNEDLRPASHAGAHLGKHQLVGQLPQWRRGDLVGQDFCPLRAPHPKCPAVNPRFGEAAGLHIHPDMNLLVHARHEYDNGRLYFEESLWKMFDKVDVSQWHAMVEQGKVHVPGGDVRKRKK